MFLLVHHILNLMLQKRTHKITHSNHPKFSFKHASIILTLIVKEAFASIFSKTLGLQHSPSPNYSFPFAHYSLTLTQMIHSNPISHTFIKTIERNIQKTHDFGHSITQSINTINYPESINISFHASVPIFFAIPYNISLYTSLPPPFPSS